MSAREPKTSSANEAEAGAGRLLYCHCAYAKVVPAKVKTEMLRRLGASGRDFEAVPDLCEMSASKDPKLEQLAACEELTLVACYPRAVRWLFHGAGHTLNEKARVLNMREASAEELAGQLGLPAETSASEPKTTTESSNP